MKKSSRILLPLYLSISLLIGLAAFALPAGPVFAQDPTPTLMPLPEPDADGNIYYIAQPGDSCQRISTLTGVTLQTIRQLNNLSEACNIFENQKILLGRVETAPETPQAPVCPPATQPGHPPTPSDGVGEVCVVLFNDLNGNNRRDEFETHLYGGVASLNDRLGRISLTGTTVAGDPDTAPVTRFASWMFPKAPTRYHRHPGWL